MKKVGAIQTRAGPDDFKTLSSINFQTGDYLDIGIMSNNN
jgi:hypothetical protein